MKELIKRIYKWITAIKADKLLHFIAGILITQISFILLDLFISAKYAVSVAFMFSCIVCALKELLYDHVLEKGVASWKDFIAGFLGSFIGILLVIFII